MLHPRQMAINASRRKLSLRQTTLPSPFSFCGPNTANHTALCALKLLSKKTELKFQ